MKKLYILIVALFVGSTAFAQAPTMSWVDITTGSDDEIAQSICSDPAGNIYVAGAYYGTADFDPGVGVIQRSSAGADYDGYIVKYNSAGIFQWVATFGGVDSDAVISIAADATSVYVTGWFSGSFINFNPNGTATTLSAVGEADAFFAKYTSSSGVLSFVKQIGSSESDGGAGIALDATSNIYVTGSFSGTADFDALSTAGTEIAWGGTDMFIAKYNSSGAYLWSADLGSVGDDAGKSIAVNGNNVWVAGYYSDTFYADPNDYSTTASNLGSYDGYFGQYSATNGTLIWGGFIRSTGDDVINSVWADATNVYTGGYFSGSATMVADIGTKTVTSIGNLDAFVARHTIADKQLQWINPFGGLANDYVNVLTSDGGSIYATGAFAGTMDVDASNNTVQLTNTSSTYDAFLVKYNYIIGSHVNSFNIGGSAWDEGSSLLVANGYMYWAGVFQNTVDVDPSPGTTNSKAAVGGYDSFVSRFTPNEPTSSPTSLTITNVGSTTFDMSFAPVGFPDGFLTMIKQGSSTPTTTPVDGISYSAGATLGDGTIVGVGPSIAFTVGSRTPATQYSIIVYPYNGSGTTTNYRLTNPATSVTTTVAASTEPANSPGNPTATSLSTTSFTVNFTAAVGSPGGYIAVRGTGTNPTTDPVDGVSYTAGTALGNGTVVFVGGLNATAGATVTFAQTGLSGSTQYFYKIYSFNGSGGTINYRTTLPGVGSFTTLSLAAEPTAQPTNLTFTNVGPKSFTINFTAAATANLAGYIGIISTTPSTFVPADGTAYTQGTKVENGVTDATVSFVGSTSTQYTYTDVLEPSTTYYFRIFAYNGSGVQINYLTSIGPLAKSQATTAPTDITGPTIVDTSPTTSAGNTTVKITATLTDAGSGVAGAYITYYAVNGTTDGYKDMVNTSGNNWEATIEASYNTEAGVEYLIYATDNEGNMSNSPTWKTVAVQFTGDGIAIPFTAGSAKESYRIISIPLVLSKKSITDVFGDDLGDYDKTKYRVFRYQNGATTELSGTGQIETGKGYWFIAADSKAVDSGPGVTVAANQDTPISIPITTGWNQIGNPFNYDINWATIKGHAGNSDKTIGEFKAFNSGFAPANQLKKLSGGFVMITGLGDAQLRIPAFDDGGNRIPAPVNFANALGSDIWAVDLKMSSGGVENVFGGFGMHPEASELNDRFDDFTLPRFLDYLELNYDKNLFGSPFTKDIVPTSAQHVWEFEVASNLSDEIIELHWDNFYFGNTDQQLVLWDVEQQRAVDMKSENSYSIMRSQAGRFKVFYGSESFVKTETRPYMPVFHSVSPVPSSGNVTFSFSVPEANGQGNTRLIIYNLMGQKMANLVDSSLPAGYHQAVWNIEDGTKPAAGVYISVLKFGDSTLQKRLIIK